MVSCPKLNGQSINGNDRHIVMRDIAHPLIVLSLSYLRILGICQRLTLQTSYLDSCGGKISLSWRLPGLWLIWVIGRFNSIIMRTSLRWMWLLVVTMRWVCERGPSYGSVEWNEIIKPRTHIFSFKLADCWFWEKAREAFQRSKFDAIINWAS